MLLFLVLCYCTSNKAFSRSASYVHKIYANETNELGEYREEKETIYLVLMSSSNKTHNEHLVPE